MSETRRSLSWPATCALCATFMLLGSRSPTRAQEPAPAKEEGQGPEIENLLRERDRVRLHPGNPLEIVGLEQGDNNLRARTPALANSDRAPKQLDSGDLYQRTLSMYDSGARFNQPPLLAAAPGERLKIAAARRAPAALLPAEPEAIRQSVTIASLLACLFAICVLVWRRLKLERAQKPFRG